MCDNSQDVAAETAEVERKEQHTPVQDRPQWSSEHAFVLSTAAAGVGLGNLWRFPYILGDNGGGAFLIAYLLIMLIIAVPLAALEIAAGRVGHGSTVAVFRRLARPAVVFGWAVVGLTLVINTYYFVVSGWTLSYAGFATVGLLPSFSSFQSGWGSLVGLGLVSLMVGAVLIMGLSGIERFAKFLMPGLIVAVVGLAAYGVMFGNAGKATSFLFSFSASDFANPGLWAAAFGQAFYSLAIGQGYLITYGSYLPRGIHMVRAIGFVAAFNVAVAILAGLMIFTLVFELGLDPAAGSALAFEVMPQAFRAMPGGMVVAAIFFWLFFFAALSSAIAGAKVVTVPLSETFSINSATAVALGVGLVALLGIPSALSYAAPQWTMAGEPILDMVDSFAGSGAVIATALGGAAIAGWSLTLRRWQTVMERTPNKLTLVLIFIARWVCPPLGIIGSAVVISGL